MSGAARRSGVVAGGGEEMEASLLQVGGDSLLALSLLGWGGVVSQPLLLWARPQYEDDGRELWRVLPGQGPWSGGLLLPLEVELIRQGRVAIELREMVREGLA